MTCERSEIANRGTTYSGSMVLTKICSASGKERALSDSEIAISNAGIMRQNLQAQVALRVRVEKMERI